MTAASVRRVRRTGRRTVDQHHQRAGPPGGPVPVGDGRVGPLRPRQRRAVRIRRVGRRQHHRDRRSLRGSSPGASRTPAPGPPRRPWRTARRPAPRRSSPRRIRPVSSSADSTRYTPANPPAVPSATTAPRVTMPCRSSSTSAAACVRSVGSVSTPGTSDQRPTTDGGAARRSPALPPPPAGPLRPADSSASPDGPRIRARGAGAGAVGRAPTGQPGPQRRQRVAGDQPGEHQVPQRIRDSAESSVAADLRRPPRRRAAGRRTRRRRRARRAIGPVQLAGAGPPRRSRATGGQRRRSRPGAATPSPSSPAAIRGPSTAPRPPLVSSSSIAGVYPATRAGRTSVSSADAGQQGPGQLLDGAQRRRPTPRRASDPRTTPMPFHAGRNRASACRLDRLHLGPQRGERPAAQQPQHLGVDELGTAAGRRATGRRRAAGTRPPPAARRRPAGAAHR